MTRDPVTVPPQLPLGRLVDEVIGHRTYTTYPVVDDGRPIGLVPFARVAEVPRAAGTSARCRTAWCRSSGCRCCGGRRGRQALAEIQQSAVNRGLVLDADGRLAGILSISDIADALETAAGLRRRLAALAAASRRGSSVGGGRLGACRDVNGRREPSRQGVALRSVGRGVAGDLRQGAAAT